MHISKKYFLKSILGFVYFFSLAATLHAKPHGECYSTTIEYLYWNPRVDGLVYAFDNPEGLSGGTVFPIGNITARDQKFNWNSGTRLGITYFLPQSSLDCGFYWTFFQSNSFTSTSNHPLAAPIVGFVIAPFPNEAQSRWNLHFNTFILDVGYHIELPYHFLLRPHMGILGGLIKQKTNYKYFNLPLTGITASIQREHFFRGIGPHTGIDLQWYFCGNASLISKISTSIVFAKINNQDQYIFPTTISTFKENPNRVRTIMDAYLGLGFDGCICNCPYEIAIGYELEYFWSIFQSLLGQQALSSPGAAWSDLSLNGLTLSLSLKI